MSLPTVAPLENRCSILFNSCMLYHVVPQPDALESDVTQSISKLQDSADTHEPKEEAETQDSAVADIFDGQEGTRQLLLRWFERCGERAMR